MAAVITTYAKTAAQLVGTSIIDTRALKEMSFTFQATPEAPFIATNTYTLLPAGTAVLYTKFEVITPDAGGGVIAIGEDSTSDGDNFIDNHSMAATTVHTSTVATAIGGAANAVSFTVATADLTTAKFKITFGVIA